MSEQTSLSDMGAAPALPDLSTLVTASKFHELARDGGGSGVIVAKDFADVGVEKQAGPGRRLKFTLTSGSVDRDRDVIKTQGLVWEHFERNPVWLFGHQTSAVGGNPPLLGVVVERKSGAKRTDVAVEYAPKEVNPLAEFVYSAHLWRLEVKALNDHGGAASIGAMPMEYNYDRSRGGVNFEKTEVLEGSDVMLPANRDALMRMKSAGIDLDPLGDWAAKLLEADGIWLDKVKAEMIAKSLDPARGLAVFELPVRDLAKELGVEPEPVFTPATDNSGGHTGLDAAAKALQTAAEAIVATLGKLAPQKATTAEPPTEPKSATVLSQDEIVRAMLKGAEAEYVAQTGRPLTTTKEPIP